jgi:hypothetical protein
VAHGPFVMNTIEEIRQAYADRRIQAGKGTFGIAEIVEALTRQCGAGSDILAPIDGDARLAVESCRPPP